MTHCTWRHACTHRADLGAAMLEYMSGALVVASLTLSAVLQNEEAHTSNMSVEELISCKLLHL